MTCPICNKKAEPEFRPFCSKHCADIDLGRWLNGSYRVPAEPATREEMESSTRLTDNDLRH